MKKILLMFVVLFTIQTNYAQTTVTPKEGSGSIWVKVDCNGGGFCGKTSIKLDWGNIHETRVYNRFSAQTGKVGCIVELKYYGGVFPCTITSSGSKLEVVQSPSKPASWNKAGYDIYEWSEMYKE